MTMIPIPADRDEWLRLRRGYVGASESPALMGPEFSAAYNLSAFALHHIKAGNIPAPDIENERITWGNRLERVIAEGCCEQEGWKLHPGMFAIDDAADRMAATLDFIIVPSAEDIANGFTGPGVLEIKNVDGLQYWKKWDGGEPPSWILIQHQHQFACSGLTWGAIGAFVGGNHLKVLRYRRHEGMVATIRGAVNAFWRGVDAGVPPEPDDKESSAYAVRKLFGAPIGNDKLPVDLSWDNELPTLCAEEKRLRDEAKRIKNSLDATCNRIRLKVENNRYVTAGGFRITRSIGADIPDRPAVPGEIIRGRKGADRLTVSEIKEKAA